MPLDPRPIALVLVGLAGCDWPVTVGELRDDAAADRVAVVSDLGRDATADVPAETDAGCAAPRVSCGAACVDLAGDPANCGACARACAALNATGTCAAGACGFTCTAGFGDCDRNAANGCEARLSDSAGNCGACGVVCMGGATCVAGACTGADAGADAGGCASGFFDCDRNGANGCEVNLLNDRNNCGACGAACPTAQTCTLGVCR